MNRYLILIFLMAVQVSAMAQQPLSVGDPMPQWKFKPLVNETTDVQLGKDNSKALLIDFWATTCAACYKLMPKLAQWQQKFKDDLKVILISDDDREEDVQKVFAKRTSLKQLGLPLMKKDTAFLKLFPHDVVPHIILVGADGIIKAITGHENINETNLSLLVNRKPIDLPVQSLQNSLDATLPFIASGVTTRDNVLFNSVLIGAIPGLGSGEGFVKIDSNRFRLYCANNSFKGLLEFAWQDQIRLTLADYPTRIIIQKQGNVVTEEHLFKNLFCYELIIPFVNRKSSTTNALNYMRADIDRYFNMQSCIEQKKEESFVIKANDNAGSKNNEEMYIQHWLGSIEFNNVPLAAVIAELQASSLAGLPVIIEGDREKRFTCTFKKNYGNWKELAADLNKQGIRLSVQPKEMDILMVNFK